MTRTSASVLQFSVLAASFLACTTEIDVFTDAPDAAAGTTTTATASSGSTTPSDTASTTTTGGGGDTGAGGAGTSSSGAGGAVELPPDPNLPGQYMVEAIEENFTVSATGHTFKMRAVFPTGGPDAGPFPVILVGHGFQTAIGQYESYLQRLASFGYVAVAPDFPAPFLGNKHIDNARDLAGGLDWIEQQPQLKGISLLESAGASGHSLGGKAAVLAASFDARIKASITLDPVDSSIFCSAMDCPDASNKLPLAIPMAFIGETLDATAASFIGQACAPEADNFETFYAKAGAPSLKVEVLGASHLSFVDNPLSGICKAPTAKNEDVLALSQAMVVAFYERHLKGKADYDVYLTGSEAQARYVDTMLAVIESK